MKEEIEKLLKRKEKEMENAKYPEDRLWVGGQLKAIKTILTYYDDIKLLKDSKEVVKEIEKVFGV